MDESLDPVFEPSEQLYRRFESQKPTIRDIEFPRCSVNRSKYSEPKDALEPRFHHCGVLAFCVADIPPKLEDSVSNSRATFQIIHCPELGNYAHSEIRSYKTDPNTPNEPSKTLKLLFRSILLSAAQVLIDPQK
jgi:hypothetical protein